MSLEDEFVESVEKIEPGDGLRAKVTALYRPERRGHRAPALKYAACFTLVLAVLAGGALFQPLRPVQGAARLSYGVSAPATGFTVVVNAATASGERQEELKPGRTFRFATAGSPISGTQMLGCRSEGNHSKENWEGFYGFQLKCIGNDIDKVTYETNRGEFQNLVKMNAIQKLYYDTHGTLAGSLWEKTMLPAGGNLAYKPVGAEQTLAPDSDGVLYLRLTMATDHISTEELDNDLKFTTKYQKELLEGTEIRITVLFRNGTKSTKTVRLSYPGGELTGDEKVAVTIVQP